MSTPDPAVTDWVPLWTTGQMNPVVPSCCAYASALVSQPSGASGVIPLNAEAWDTDGMHDPASSNSRITIRTAGLYSFVGSGTFAPNTVGNHRLLALTVNGSGTWNEVGGVVGSFPGGAVRMQVIMIRQFLNVGDYVEMLSYQDSGGALNLSHDARGGPELTAAYLGPGIPVGGIGYGDGAWTVPTLTSYWTHYAEPFGPVRYRKLASGLVTMEGLATFVSLGNPIFTLPAGSRPSLQGVSTRALIFNTGSSYGAGIAETIRVYDNGNVEAQAPQAGWVSLAGVQFYAG